MEFILIFHTHQVFIVVIELDYVITDIPKIKHSNFLNQKQYHNVIAFFIVKVKDRNINLNYIFIYYFDIVFVS